MVVGLACVDEFVDFRSMLDVFRWEIDGEVGTIFESNPEKGSFSFGRRCGCDF